MGEIKDLALNVAKQAREGKVGVKADPFDPITFPIGAIAGDNKFGTIDCPTCGKPPTVAPDNTKVFLFRDRLSQKEYKISGMCQECQDSVFGISDEDAVCADHD